MMSYFLCLFERAPTYPRKFSLPMRDKKIIFLKNKKEILAFGKTQLKKSTSRSMKHLPRKPFFRLNCNCKQKGGEPASYGRLGWIIGPSLSPRTGHSIYRKAFVYAIKRPILVWTNSALMMLSYLLLAVALTGVSKGVQVKILGLILVLGQESGLLSVTAWVLRREHTGA